MADVTYRTDCCGAPVGALHRLRCKWRSGEWRDTKPGAAACEHCGARFRFTSLGLLRHPLPWCPAAQADAQKPAAKARPRPGWTRPGNLIAAAALLVSAAGMLATGWQLATGSTTEPAWLARTVSGAAVLAGLILAAAIVTLHQERRNDC